MKETEKLQDVNTGSLADKTKLNKIKIVLTIFIVILSLVLCFNVGVYAAYALAATEVNYTKSDGTTVSVKSALDELYTLKPLAKEVSVGDYVAYDAGTHSYTSPVGTGSSHGNGNSSQTFTSSSSLKWRVLGWDEETGGVMLISEAPIGSFTLKGAIGYLYAEQELNEICKIYGYGTGANTSKKFSYVTGDTIEGTTVGTITGSGARSIKAEDVNKICGVTPSTALKSNYGKAPYTKSIYYPTTKNSSGKSTSIMSRIDINISYSYVATDYISNTTEKYNMLFGNYIRYLTATRYIESATTTTTTFGVLSVVYHGDGSSPCGESLCLGNSSTLNESSSSTKNYRPIVFLKSSIKTNGKDASGAWNIIDK